MKTQEALSILRRYEGDLRARGVRRAALFASRARGDNRADSDIDIMIEIEPNASLIPTRGLADSLGLPKSSRVRIDGGEGEIRHATGAYTSRGL